MNTKKNMNIIGKRIPKLDAGDRVTGKSIYGTDIELPGMLHGAILRSKFPSAIIESIDVSKAKALPGVECVITADDVDVTNLSYRKDHPVLKKDEVNCIRDEIAAVAAVSKDVAEKALELIEVNYIEREGIFDPIEALKNDAPRINKFNKEENGNKNISESFHYEHGDLEAEKKKSACIVSRQYVLPKVAHACMAPSNVTADYSPVDGQLTLHSSTQVPFLYQREMSQVLKMDPSKIRVVQPIIGGGFGSKLDLHPFEPICALLSIKTGKPVQILYSREEEFLYSAIRQSMVIDLTTGADENGKFTFREVKIMKDNGAYTSWGARTSFVMMQTFSSLYQTPACVYDADAVYTNNVFAGSFRGFGNPQATFALERNIDLMAHKLGMDRSEIRLLNANFPGEVTGQGLEYHSCGHKQALEAVVKNSGYPENKNGERYKRGFGFASMLHVGGGAKIYPSDGCGTTLKMDPYGFLTIITGSSEIGQGSETVLAMMAGEELGIGLDRIKVINTDTSVKPWDVGVHASRTSFVAGNSLLGALEILKEKLSAKAAQLLNTTPDDLVFQEGEIRSGKTGDAYKIDKIVRELHFKPPHELCEVSYFYEPSSEFQGKDYKGNVSGCYTFAAQAVEVEVDTLTGKVDVLNVHVGQDVGKVLNPLGLEGQIEGGVVMGMGYALSEEMIFEDGYLRNPTFHDYKVPTARDIPEISFYPVETNEETGPFGAKGVAEAPLVPTPAAIANAVSNILDVEINSLPVTPEKVLKAICDKEKGQG
ncbi:MAG: xanthine dehydrogenase family protein molybdopterin-binding subunit [Candidatus Marinimicrobia bacterium]|nr:xanthine dehydrogenase family protein molybdopterin-binding subunit [Candidatus Neomarinimicrobiota bacterium]